MSNQTETPNILFFFPDQWRFDWVGRNPDIAVRTPNLDQLEKNGVCFPNTVCPSPVCAPSRACVAAGTEYDQCPVKGNLDNLPVDYPTVYRILRDAGYHVMGCGKFDLNKGTCTSESFAWGVDGQRFLNEWGFSAGINNEGKMDGLRCGREEPQGPYFKFLEDRGLREVHVDDFERRKNQATFPTKLPDDAYCDNWIGQNGLDLIDSVPDGKPWFLQVNFTGPHSPWDVTESMTELYKGKEFPPPNKSEQLTPEHHQEVRQNYSAMIENIDRWTKIYLDKLEERGELENTLIVYTSDHGEMLGDHNGWDKSKPWHPSVAVPFVISGPGVRKNAKCDLPTTNLDMTATFLDYAGLETPDGMDSRSLRGLLEGKTDSHREVVLSGLSDWRMAYDGKWKYVEGYEDSPQLFDLENDILENNNLASDSAHAEQVARLKAWL